MISGDLSVDLGVNAITLPLCMAEIWTSNAPSLEPDEVRKCVIAFAAICRDRNIAPELAAEMITDWCGNKVLTGSMIEEVYNSDLQLTCQALKESEYIFKYCERDHCDYNNWRKDFNFIKLEDRKKKAIEKKFKAEETVAPAIEDDSKEKDSLATKLSRLARKNCTELWHSPEKVPYITLFLNGHKEYKKLDNKSTLIKAWLSRLGSDFLLETPSTTAIKSVITYLEGVALYDGPEYELFVRKAEHDGKIYVDIGDETWRVIEISKDGWKVIDDSPVKFRRPKSLLPLPVPEVGGEIGDLKPLINAPSDETWIKFTAWLSQAFWCKGPFVHLHVRGPQGSAKSALAETTKNIIDPSRAPRRHLPKSPRDLMMACQNEAVPSFDNVSEFADDISDTICIISTGGSSAARELYTDSDEALIFAKNPIIMNGIADPSQRGDLLDRLMILDLDSIPEDKRVSEKEMKIRLDESGPKILGVLLDATVTGLLNIDNLTLTKSPRMADFTAWAIACSPVFEWKPDAFYAYYQEARAMDQMDLAEGNFLMRAIFTFHENRKHETWEGTATEILNILNHQEMIREGYEPDDWPRKAQNVGTMVRRLIGPAQSMGIAIRLFRKGGKNLIEIKKLDTQCKLDGLSTPEIHDKTDNGVGCVSCVSFSSKKEKYRKKEEGSQEAQEGNKKLSLSFEPTQATQDTLISDSEDSSLPEPTQNQCIIRVLKEIGQFSGVDGMSHGPFKYDEIASIPEIHALNFEKKGFATIINDHQRT